MKELFNRTWHELNEEVSFVVGHLRHWWGSMSDGNQLFLVGVICAASLLLGLRRPTKAKVTSYSESEVMSTFQQFMFAAVVLVVFTFGVDIAVESVS